MKKLVLFTFLFTLLSLSSNKGGGTLSGVEVTPDILVYLCDNGTTKVYHLKEDCCGLKRCEHEVLVMREKDAKARGLRLCGYED